MRNSLAYQRISLFYLDGIISNHSNGLGLNPNLNLEDQYIQNLLKQIHFLSLETKLIKQKQSQNQESSVMKFLNKDPKPVIDHLLTSNEKYKQMRSTLQAQLNDLDNVNTRLFEEQQALIKKKQYIERKKKQFYIKGQNQKMKYQRALEQIKDKLRSERNRCQDLQIQNKKLVNQVQFQQNELEKIIKGIQTDQILKQQQNRKLTNETKLESEDQVRKDVLIQTLKKDIFGLKEKIETNTNLIANEQQNIQLQKQLIDQQKNLSNLKFKLRQSQSIIKLAEQQKEKEINERRSLQDEYDKLNLKLSEIRLGNQAKIQKGRKLRTKESTELKKSVALFSKLQKQLIETKKRFQKSEQLIIKYRLQQNSLNQQRQKLSNNRSYLENQFNKISQLNQSKQKDLMQIDSQMQQLEKKLFALKKENKKSLEELFRSQQQYTYIHTKYQYLQKNYSLAQSVKKIKMEDLRNVIQKNSDVNESVSVLMQRWDEIRNFSKV